MSSSVKARSSTTCSAFSKAGIQSFNSSSTSGTCPQPRFSALYCSHLFSDRCRVIVPRKAANLPGRWGRHCPPSVEKRIVHTFLAILMAVQDIKCDRMAVPPVLLRSFRYSSFGARPIQIYNLLILHTNLLPLAIRPFTHIDRKPLRHVTFFQKIKCRGQNSFAFCPRTFHSDNHIRKCIGHPAHKVPLALHVRL